ncbi:uncharacterized protein LOC117579187 [Drosophila guanche]|uniref:Blast:EF-hand domain-containing family member B n=1 Tax=Drosophila guanche TaxID=7266 RepID=A0A3B0JM41_DROGU|nr:uncharacterized protein LOC117579187 [Drosophila guanche]SPP76490.1 blast:EF-hand domain-containing family member B [Drosophila guanche]
MANIGRFVDRNADIRAAGLTISYGDLVSAQDCLSFAHPAELGEQLMRQECRRRVLRPAGPRTPIIPSNNVDNIFSSGEEKSRFLSFKQMLYEDIYSRRSKLGSTRPAHSKPESVTNDSQTFGCSSTSSESLYPIILPPKSAEQVNKEYNEAHDKRIISHNHYFPSEKINRNYTHPFDRRHTFGQYLGGDANGSLMKRCLKLKDGPELILSKRHQDFIERQNGTLGKKIKYLYEVPTDIIHGVTYPFECDTRMLFENTSPCVNTDKLRDALKYLITWRRALHYKRTDFHMHDLTLLLEMSDKEHTGQLPLSKIIDVLHRLQVKVDAHKMRTALAHFPSLIIDEGCATERVDYENFCRLIGQQVPLPMTDSSSSFPAKLYSMDTTYRMLCADRHKKPDAGRVEKKSVLTPQEQDLENKRVKDLLAPELGTISGLVASDFSCARPKKQMEQIFQKIIAKEDFETAWQSLMAEHKSPEGMASVNQFQIELKRREANADRNI